MFTYLLKSLKEEENKQTEQKAAIIMINQWQKKGGVGCGWGEGWGRGWGYNIPKSNTVSLYMPKYTWTHRYLSAAQLLMHGHTRTHALTHARTHARTHTHTHTHTHTQTHTHTRVPVNTEMCVPCALELKRTH